MDNIKEAFNKVKDDINFLKNQFKDLENELQQIQLSILNLTKITADLSKNKTSTGNEGVSTDRQITSTHTTDKLPFKSLKTLNLDISTGNEGVSTDRQTVRQTDNQRENPFHREEKVFKKLSSSLPLGKPIKPNYEEIIPQVSNVLNQLDRLKLKTKNSFKNLTNQEMLIFSAIYQLEDEGILVDYSILSNHLNLSESSIRDYVQRIIKKNIPISKEKVNNKKIILKIPQDLRKLATLNTLLDLRR